MTGTDHRLDEARWTDLCERRATAPETIAARWAERRRRSLSGPDGRLLVVAADHPARSAVAVRDDPLAMADRRDLLGRLLAALAVPGVDGLLASADIADDLVTLGALESKVVFGTMNRGGLAGSAWELDDPLTAYGVDDIVERGLDGGKVLLRIDPGDPGCRHTLVACADAVRALARRGLPAMVEPLPYRRDAWGRARLDTDTGAAVRAVGVAAGLGGNSAYTWMKLPAGPDLARVAGASSCPVLVLGGAPGPDAEAERRAWREALALPQVRGLVVGRALLYPPDDDVVGAVRVAAEMVHGDGTGP